MLETADLKYNKEELRDMIKLLPLNMKFNIEDLEEIYSQCQIKTMKKE